MKHVSQPPSTSTNGPTRPQVRAGRPNRASGTPVVLAVAAALLTSLMLSPRAAGAATPALAPAPSAVRTPLDAALNGVVTAGVPGIIVRVQDPRRAPRSYVAGVAD